MYIQTEDFLNKVKEFEGLRLNPYKCPSGVLTIGYGHTHGVVPGMSITNFDAEVYLNYDLHLVRNYLEFLHPNLIICSGLFYALTDFIFNVGFTKYKNSTLKKVVDSIKDYSNLSENDINALSVQFLLWTKSKGKTLCGLEKRRMFEISLLHEK